MPGFYMTNMKKTPCIEICDGMIFRDKIVEECSLFQYTTEKFYNDKCFDLANDYFSCVEGVVLNKKELYIKYQVDNMPELTYRMYQKATAFFNEFRGSFSGIYYDRETKRWLVYTSHYGDNAVFYYKSGNQFIISSSLEWLATGLGLNGIEYNLNEKAVYYMLTYGFMADEATYIEGVNRLLPGHYIEIFNGNFQINEYYALKSDKLNLKDKSESELIEILDELFVRAVKREYEKDLEYGYKHLVELSGGLDSRMNYWIAKELGYKNMLAVTFCQSNYTDELVAKQIAAYWNEEILVWPLDSAKHLYDVDRNVELNFGVSLYSGIGGELRIMDNLNMRQYGVLHTGQLGGAILGTFLKSEQEMDRLETAKAYSNKLLDRYCDQSFKAYKNKDEYLMNTRGFLGCLGSHLFARYYTEECAPFLDADVMDFCFSCPISMRIDRRMYIKWILIKHPEAAKFVWERTGELINKSDLYLKWKETKQVAWDVITHPSLLLRKIGLPVNAPTLSDYRGMNPMDKWLRDNKELKNFERTYYLTNICKMKKIMSDKLLRDIEELYECARMEEKTQIFTVLSAVKLLFLKEA